MLSISILLLATGSLFAAETGAGESAAAESAAAEPATPPTDIVDQEDDDEVVDPTLTLPGIRMLDTTHSYFSKNIEGLADTVDSIFGDDRIFEEASGTYLQVRSSVIYGKFGELSFDTRVRAKISLDNLNDRVQILFSDDDEPLDSGGVTSGGELLDTVTDLDPAASLQFILLEQRRWDVRLQPGIKVKTPIDPFFKIRFSREQRFDELWLWRSTIHPAWYDSRGYEFPVSVDFERGTGEGGFFRSRTVGIWREEEQKNVRLQQSLLFSHPVGRLHQFAYEGGVAFEREPHWRDTDYFATVRLRHNIHQGWIFLEIKPQVLFERINDFKANPSLAFTVELFFGSSYLK